MDIDTGLQFQTVPVGPINPQLAAAIAADAAGLSVKAREHFETALAQARALPSCLLEPAVLYWQGRSLVSRSSSQDAAARGRGMVEAALGQFQSREMVLHAGLAEDLLRGG